MFQRICHVSILSLAVSVALVGCGPRGRPEPKRVPVSGSVTLDGKPLSDGMIYFKNIAEGAVDGIDIKDGKFEGKAQTGERRVEICQFREEGYIDMGFSKIPNKVDKIPRKYNMESKLTATIPDAGTSDLHFEVTSK